MYFNHAFRKSFLGKEGSTPDTLDVVPVVQTADLTAGQIGLFDAKTFAAVTSTGKPFILAQGSYFTSDKIGPVHGGYKESVKSKVINPKYISRVFTTCYTLPVNQIKRFSVCNLECGKTYRLRLDLKGSPALRFLSHNIYRTLDAFTGCCTDDCSATCTGALVDPTVATIKWAKQIVENPIVSQYLKVTVVDWDGNTVATQASTSAADIATFVAALDAYTSTFDPNDAGAATAESNIIIEVAYVDTRFGNCTFTPTDHYELQPLLIFGTLTDETGDACNVQCFAPHDDQVPAQAQGVGESVLRDLILSGRYRQEAFPDSARVESLRMREIEGNPSLTGFDRTAYFNSINILHNVPRLNNPTGTFDNDQYLLTIYVPSGVSTVAFLDNLQETLNCAGNGVEIESWNAGRSCSDMTPTVEGGDACLNPVVA